jgi:NhaC family Na+:H+ antiporter
MKENHKMPLWLALLPIIILVLLLAVNVFLFGDNALGGANQVALLLAASIAAIISIFSGLKWNHLFDGVIKSIASALPALLILLLIGALAGTWMISGIVPAMVYYGLKILSPVIFLFAACFVCAIVSVATGSSWSTVATIGVALLAIGKALGFHEGIIAGAIISGAYFGDKMSPLSDTTNLAPAMAGTDLFTHIRYMSITTIPSIVLTLGIFLVIGFTSNTSQGSIEVNELMEAVKSKFFIHPILFIVPIIVIILIVKQVPALPALLLGSILGGICAVLFQPNIINEIAGGNHSYIQSSYISVINAMSGSTEIVTQNESINELLKTKGMFGMLNTIWLIICAMVFGGIMESSGMLTIIANRVVLLAKNTTSLIATTAGTCVFFNATASDQYLAIIVPGRMFAPVFKKRGLMPENLSRTLEDSGTVTSVLFPWNTCGATQASVLGVATGTYWMYCFFNIISPLMSVIIAAINFKIRKIKTA